MQCITVMKRFHSCLRDEKISLRGQGLRRLTADVEESAFLDGLDGAVVGAGAAADTNIGIDDESVFTLRDSLDGAVVSAGTALDTSISNLVSHDIPSIYVFEHSVPQAPCITILTPFPEKAIFFLRPVYFFRLQAKITR